MRLAAALLLGVLSFAQNGSISGTWKSAERIGSEPRIELALKEADGKIGGTVIMRGVTDDDNNSTTLNLVIDEPQLAGDKLSFKAKMPDENVTEWEVKFQGDTAVAAIVADNDGPSSDIQYWKMKRDR
jgi:hypothetical protein